MYSQQYQDLNKMPAFVIREYPNKTNAKRGTVDSDRLVKFRTDLIGRINSPSLIRSEGSPGT